MKREIRFRAWDSKKMLNNVGYHPNIIQKHDGYKDGEVGQYTISPAFDSYELMQFTGLKDKNGTDIYEGDVIKWTNGIIRKDLEMVPNEHIIEVSIDSVSFCNISQFGAVQSSLEIIGNIYEPIIKNEKEQA